MRVERNVNIHTTDAAVVAVDAFHHRLRAARGLRSWSQKDLARRAGMATKTIIHFEEGFSRPSMDTLRRLATTLEVSTDYLLGIAVTPAVAKGDALYRAIGHLSDSDRELATGLLKVLLEHSNLKRLHDQ